MSRSAAMRDAVDGGEAVELVAKRFRVAPSAVREALKHHPRNKTGRPSRNGPPCSTCGASAYRAHTPVYKQSLDRALYCPSCGARPSYQKRRPWLEACAHVSPAAPANDSQSSEP